MPYQHVTYAIPKALDRRRKLSDVDRVKVMLLYYIDRNSINGIARHFSVSKRLVQFILFPERHAKNLEDRAARGGWQQYYDKGVHAKTMKRHRRYKQALFLGGLLKMKG